MLNYNIPDPSSVENICDWVELFLVVTNEDLSKSDIGSYIEESKGEDVDEDFVDNVWQELKIREILYGLNPPYRFEDRLIKSNISLATNPEYLTCLIFALEGNAIDSSKSGKLFERIVNEAVKYFFNGETLVYGFPSKMKVCDICGRLNEKFHYEIPAHRKDRNLDVILWKPFDSRASQLVILIQCAAGHNWESKIKELNPIAWSTYINFACKHPLKGFAIPCVITDANRLHEYSLDGGIIIDRIRLYKNLVTNANITTAFKDELRLWCNKRLTEIIEN